MLNQICLQTELKIQLEGMLLMNTKIITSCTMILLLTLTGFADANLKTFEKEWDRTYGGTGSEVARSMIQTSDNGFALAGDTDSYGEGNTDMWLVKTDANGKAEWNRTYGGIGDDTAHSVIQTKDDGFVLVGSTTSYGAGDHDWWFVKIDASGQSEWNRTYGGLAWDWAHTVILTPDEGFVIGGSTLSYGAGSQDFWLIKTNANGLIEWNSTYGGTDYERGLSMIQTTDGGFALAGHTWSFGAGNQDFWLVKTNGSGYNEWSQTYGGTAYDSAHSIIQTDDGGFVLVGDTESFGAGGKDFWLIKTDAEGQIEWNETYGGSGEEGGRSISQTEDGGFVIAGWTESYGPGIGNFWLIRTDATGQSLSNQTFGGISDDWSTTMIQISDGEFVLAGATGSYGGGGNDMWLVKVFESEVTTSSSTATSTSTSDSKVTPTSTSTSNSEESSSWSSFASILTFMTLIIFRKKLDQKKSRWQ